MVRTEDLEEEPIMRNLLCIYWSDGELFVELLFFRIIETYPADWFIGRV